MVAIFKAPSPESNPDSLLPFKTTVGVYATVNSWYSTPLKDMSPVQGYLISPKLFRVTESTAKAIWFWSNKSTIPVRLRLCACISSSIRHIRGMKASKGSFQTSAWCLEVMKQKCLKKACFLTLWIRITNGWNTWGHLMGGDDFDAIIWHLILMIGGCGGVQNASF